MMPSFKNTASIFSEISFIQYFPLFCFIGTLSFAMYRCSVEPSVRYDELSQSEREHASLIDEYTRLILRQTGSFCVLI